jgi:hypothetical protein
LVNLTDDRPTGATTYNQTDLRLAAGEIRPPASVMSDRC